MRTTQKDDRYYWHVTIYRKGDEYTMLRKRGQKNIDLTPYLLTKDR